MVSIVINASNFVHNSILIGSFKTLQPLNSLRNLRKFLQQQLEENDQYKDIYLENLSTKLKPFENCFIHMSNSQGLTLPPTEQPIMLRELQPAICISPNQQVFGGSLSFVSKSLFSKSNITRDCNRPELNSCPISSLYADSLNVCVELNFLKYSMKTRPWKYFHFDFFYSQQTFPFVMDAVQLVFKAAIRKDIRKIARRIPTLEPLHVLITNQAIKGKSSNKLLKWHSSDNDIAFWFRETVMRLHAHAYHQYSVFRDLFIVMSVPTIKPNLKSAFIIQTSRITNSYVASIKIRNDKLFIMLVKNLETPNRSNIIQAAQKYSQNDGMIWSAEDMMFFEAKTEADLMKRF